MRQFEKLFKKAEIKIAYLLLFIIWNAKRSLDFDKSNMFVLVQNKNKLQP